ncbi:hypothetical protein GCM10022257_19380 [Hyunsoonleella aestuarii]|uniref:Uncharacterized protein n=1 Tax=Hyunsoonleella aestuarii TaxID=912802 RepID=A0ABP8EC71_9FLAO
MAFVVSAFFSPARGYPIVLRSTSIFLNAEVSVQTKEKELLITSTSKFVTLLIPETFFIMVFEQQSHFRFCISKVVFILQSGRANKIRSW